MRLSWFHFLLVLLVVAVVLHSDLLQPLTLARTFHSVHQSFLCQPKTANKRSSHVDHKVYTIDSSECR